MAVSRATLAQIRFGFGRHPRQPAPSGPAALLAEIAPGAAAAPILALRTRQDRMETFRALRAARRSRNGRQSFRTIVRQIRIGAVDDGARRIYNRALSPHGFFERLVAFWADHFSISAKGTVLRLFVPLFEQNAIRPHVGGKFADMLIAVVRDPAMLSYLDQMASIGPNSPAGWRTGRGLNENHARELLELHTLGAGGPYTQRDVRELAELMTGHGIRYRDYAYHFFRARAEPGAEVVLGKRYGGYLPRPEHFFEALDDFSRHPATARHLARKLAVHFVSDRPDERLVRHIAAEWLRTGGALPAVYRAMLEHPAAWAGFGGKVKRPQELVVSTLRAMGIRAPTTGELEKRRRGVFGALRQLGQPMFRAPGPDGWPEAAEDWITPQGLAARLRFAGQVGRRMAHLPLADPRGFAERTLGDALRPETRRAVAAAAERSEGFALVLASPEFNRR